MTYFSSHLSYYYFAVYPIPKQKSKVRFKQLYLGSHSELDTCSNETYFVTMTDTITSKNNGLYTWITLYFWTCKSVYYDLNTRQYQMFYCPTNALNYINCRVIKNTLKCKNSSDMFRFTQEPSSGSQIQCLAKITGMVPLCLTMWAVWVLWRHIPTCCACV